MNLMAITQQKEPHCSGKILPEKLDRILNEIFLSCQAIEHCRFIFIKDKLLRKKIQPLANNNNNITGALYLLLFYTWDKSSFSEKNPFNYFQTKNILTATKKSDKMIAKEIYKQPTHSNFILNVQSTYQSMDAVLKRAAIENIEANLIEDLHYHEIDELLELKRLGLRSVALLAIGNEF